MKKCTILFIVCLCLVSVVQAQWEYTDLSQPKFSLGSTALGNKVYFAGGDNGLQALSEVEIYDIEAEEWDTILQMSVGKTYPACVATGTKVFFAGGLDWYSFSFLSEVDIWDTETKTWTLDYLSVPRFSICAVAGENKVLFAGGANLALGETYNIVDIYDLTTQQWTVAHLSAPRCSMAQAVAGDMAFFAGGFVVATNTVSNIIDIYHFSTGTWTTETLPEGRCFFAATAVGNKVYFAGGTTQENVRTDRVDVYNIETGEWEATQYLSEARSFIYDWATTVCGKAYFAGGGQLNLNGYVWQGATDVIDIYDPELNSWTVDNLTHSKVNHTVAGLDDHLFVAGGQDPDPYSLVEIFIDPDCDGLAVPDQCEKSIQLEIYPNPSDGQFNIEIPDTFKSQQMTLIMFNIQGQKVYQQTMQAGDQAINVELPDGVYVMQVIVGGEQARGLVVIEK